MSKRPLLQWTWIPLFAAVLCVGRVEAQTLTVAYPSVTETFAPLWVAERAGIFRKYDLDPRLIYIQSGGLITMALLSGRLNIANISLSAPVGAWANGADLVALAVYSRTNRWHVMGPRSIQKPADLRGKKIASWPYGSMPDSILRMALRHHNLEPEKDVVIVQSAPGQFLTAVQVGAADAAILAMSDSLLAQKLGFHSIIDFAKLPTIPFPGSGIVVTKQYLQENRKTVKDFLRAWIEGIRKYKTDSEFALETMRKRMKNDPEILAKMYETFRNDLEEVPTVLPEGVQSVLNGLNPATVKRTNPDIKNFIDNSLIEELEKEDFISRLYSKK